MSLWKDLIFGRENGIRQTAFRTLMGRSAPQPASSGRRAGGDAPPPSGEKALNLGIEPPKDVTPPEGFEVVLHKDSLQPGQVTEVIIAGKAIAVANLDGEYCAISNTCSHAEGPLGEGELDGIVLRCPYHGWEFDVRTGACLTSPDDPVARYAVEIVRDAVCVEV